MGYRTKNSYVGNTIESEMKQLSNLRQNKPGGTGKLSTAMIRKLEQADIIEFATDPDFLGLSFEKRPAQEVILRVLYGLPLDKKQLEIFDILTKGEGIYKEGQIKSEAVLALGARSGKSFLSSICALYEATRGEYQKYVTKGEFVYICVIATREKQAIAIIQSNCLRMLENSPILKKMISKTTELEITLKNNIRIISGPCNSTAMRGLPIAVLILDEAAFYRIEGPKADDLIFGSLRPRQAQFPTNKLFLISTAGSKQGLFFNFFDEGFKIQDRLTCQASTEFMNPVIPKAFLEKEKIRDIDNFMREFCGEFSEKLESFFPSDLISRPFILAGDQPFKSGNIYSLAFDQSGLSGKDRFSLSIGHAEKDIVIIDIVRSWTTKNLDEILTDIEKLKKEYQIFNCLVDKYAIGYIRNAFQKIGLTIETRPGLAEIYVVMKSTVLQDKLRLPDRSDLKVGMRNTLALYGKSNELKIFHERGPSGHADELDSTAGAIYAITQKLGVQGGLLFWIPEAKPGIWDDDEDDFDEGPLPMNYQQL